VTWLAIDFGTCYSSAVRRVGGRLEPIKDPIEHRYSIPSSVLITPDREILVGQLAERRRRRWPDRCQSEFKHLFGSGKTLRLGSDDYTPEALVSDVLAFFKRLADDGGDEVTLAKLTVPASYQGEKRELMRDAAKLAGFAEVELLEEPVAAALSTQDRATDRLVLVYDLGGGTFDAALVRFEAGDTRVIGLRGRETIGGANLDRAIARDLRDGAGATWLEALRGARSSGGDEDTAMRAVTHEAREFCRDVKHQLSQSESFDGELVVAGFVIPYELTRSRLAELVRPQIDDTIACCRELIEAKGLAPDEIDEVLLVGGSTRLPFVRERVAELLEIPVTPLPEPELAVCLGAAVGERIPAVVAEPPPPRRRPIQNLNDGSFDFS
jgi:molecular chaperone DnaK (HSP70)